MLVKEDMYYRKRKLIGWSKGDRGEGLNINRNYRKVVMINNKRENWF